MCPNQNLITAAALIVAVVVPARAQQVRLVTSTDSGALQHEKNSESLLARPARLSVAEVPLATALTELRYRSGVMLVFSPSMLSSAPVSCNCRELTVGAALEHLLRGTALGYVELNPQILIRPMASYDAASPSLVQDASSGWLVPATGTGGQVLRPRSRPIVQEGTISGQIVEASSQRPLVGAQVHVPGTEIGTLSNQFGRYRLDQVPAGTHSVRVVLIGYSDATQTVQVASGETAVVDFRLRESAYELDEIVVTGTPGAQRLRELGNAVGQIDADQVARKTASNSITDLLGGTEPGVDISFGGGGPDPAANIRIRGAASIALSSEPLIFVDGVRVSNSRTDGPGTSGRDGGMRLNDFAPGEIASIEVVKGPAAATLYGTEASNGVINIITKSGRSGPARITTRVEAGFVSLPGLQSGEEFYDLEIGYRCQGFSGECEPGEIVRVNALRNDRERFGRVYFRKGTTQLYSASVSGASEDLSYFFSGSWDDQEGITYDSWKEKLNARANLQWTPSEKFGVQFGLGLVRSEMRSNAANQPWTLGITFQCPAPTCEPGSGDAALDGSQRGYFAYTPYAVVDYVYGGEQLNRQTASLTIDHRPWEWFSGRFTLGADWIKAHNHELYTPLPRGASGHFVPDGRKRIQSNTEDNYTIDYSATASLDISENVALSTSAGFQYYQRTERQVESEGENFPIATLSTVGAGAVLSADESYVQNKTAGVYVQEQVSWQDRLFLTGAIRFDDNSAFGENFELVSYPKISGSWVVSDERALQEVDRVAQLKLRAAWGKAGQQPSTFAAVRTYEPVTGPGGQGTITRENIGNPDVAPEVGQEWEAGFDAVFLDQQLTLQTTYYHQTRNQALIEVEVRPSMGFGGIQWQNLGQVQNQGVEIGAQFAALRGGSVGLDLGLAFSHNMGEVTDLGGLPPVELHGSNPTTNWGHQRFVKGFPMGAIFLKKIVSTDIEGELGTPEARAVNIMCEGGEIIPGTRVLSRGGGPPVPCDEAPEIYRGTPVYPTVMSGNATLTLLDGDLELYAQVDSKFGGTRIDANLAGAHVFVNSSLAILRREDPLLLAMQELEADGINQTGLLDADFARLRRVAATYHLPASLTERIGASSGSFTLSGYNVAWLWRAEDSKFGLKSLDSEARVVGAANGLQAVHHEGWPTNMRLKAGLTLAF